MKSEDDKMRVVYLVIVASVVLGWDGRSAIPKKLTSLVMDLEKFVAYPWGRVGFKHLISAVRSAKVGGNSYVMNGFLQVLQVWAYIVIPRLGKEVGEKFTDDGPPLLRYKGSKPSKVSLDDVGFIDNSGIGVDSSDWEDEVEDVEVENIVSHYKDKKKFERRMWVSELEMNTKSAQRERKRKGKEDVGECSEGVKKKRVHWAEEGVGNDEEFKTLLLEKLEALAEDNKALRERVAKMEAEIVMIHRAMVAKKHSPSPPKSAKKPSPTPINTPNPTPPPKSTKKPPLSPKKAPPKKKKIKETVEG